MHTQNDIPYKTYLTEDELPAAWYNLRADMKTKPAPLLSPATGKPVTAGELGRVFCAREPRSALQLIAGASPAAAPKAPGH